MTETESGTIGSETVATDSSSSDSSSSDTATSSNDDNAVQDETYEADLAAAIMDRWVEPGRDSRTPPRIARVLIQLGPAGRVQSWEWSRRSPQSRYNDEVAAYMDRVVERNQRFPMPTEGSPLRRTVLRDGVVVEFADDDA